MLIFSIFPIISSVIAWVFLGEALSPIKVFAIGITISGVMLVILGKREFRATVTRRHYIIGMFFGLGGAICQALGLILAKKGITTELSGLTVTLIRVLPATIVIWLVTLINGKVSYTFSKLHSKEGMIIVVASFVGSFAGLWLSMLSIKYTYIGIASTLMALPPVFLLPVSRWVFKEKLTIYSIVGTLIAIIGIAMIFLV
jgi:drug/metabolite transporter (DMT)-like permease